MPIKLLLNPSLQVTRLLPMKLGPSINPSRVHPIFCRIFPFKLKYQGFGPQADAQLGARRLSTRPFRSRPSSEFNRRGGGREVKASNSLIEDEAELSDWVSEVRKTNSFRGRFASEDESDSGMARNRGKRDRDSGKERVRGRDGEGFSMKRRREGNIGEPNWRRNGAQGESFSRNFRVSKRFDSDEERYNSGRKNGGNTNSFNGKRGGREMDFGPRRDGKGFSGGKRGFLDDDDDIDENEERYNSRRKNHGNMKSFNDGRGGREMGFEPRRERKGFRGGKRDFLDDDDDGDIDGNEEGYNSRRKNWGNMNSFNGKKGGREMGSGPRRDGKVLSGGKRGFLDDDEEDDSDIDEDERKGLMGSLGDLISEGESDDNDEEHDDAGGVSKQNAPSSLGSEKEHSVKNMPSSPRSSDSYLSETRFDQCSVSPLSLKGIKDAGYEKMTVVQEATLPVILKGKDVLAKAKTGTGKTVAFLLPSIEVVVKSPPSGRDEKRPPILVLVVCPTRELASQAASEANTLLKYHPSIGVQVVIGGTRLALEQKRMQANPCQILFATPGRLRDHLENTAGFATRLMGVKVLVLDEADHLLDMGFRKDIEKIIAAVPKQRQTLLFSATVPDEVRHICHIALRRDHEFINTVEEGSEETHSQVQQMHLVAPSDKHFPLLYALLKDHIADDIDYKVLVFCTTAMVTKLVADLLGELRMNVREIHSRKSQSYRTKVSDEFRKSKGLILVTSDVSARGVDYPDVTLVVQVGLPSDREQYIHRLGRTGRKGKEGRGILLLAPWEEFFLSTIKDLPITKSPVPSIDPDTKKKVEQALSHVDMKNKEAAYQAWLGYYNSNKTVGRDKYRLVELANEFSRSMGLDNPPAIPKLILSKMGLRNIPGLRSK